MSTFKEFIEEDINKLRHLPYVSGDTPGLYAIIETLERPLAVAKTCECVVVGEEENNRLIMRCKSIIIMACPLLHQICAC
jgi:hypothetical protein